MILFLTNTFPYDDKLREGIFNYRAAVQLSEVCDLKIIHLRSWLSLSNTHDQAEIFLLHKSFVKIDKMM